MDDVHRVRVMGPLVPYAAGFAAELTRLGYTVFSARGQLGLAAHLSRWLAGEGLDASMLTPAVAAQFLVARRGAGYTAYRGQIIARIWGADHVGNAKTLDVHVNRLRAKIEPDPAVPRHLLTVRGLGYKFIPVAPVQEPCAIRG